jgi:hypothetical protein
LLTAAGFPRLVAHSTKGGPDVLVAAAADDKRSRT